MPTTFVDKLFLYTNKNSDGPLPTFLDHFSYFLYRSSFWLCEQLNTADRAYNFYGISFTEKTINKPRCTCIHVCTHFYKKPDT